MRLAPPGTFERSYRQGLTACGLVCALGFAATLPAQSAFRRGDSNADSSVDVSDSLSTLGFLFLGNDQPSCLDAADADDSGALDITDAVYTLGYLFLGGPQPPAPGPFDCGLDPTDADAVDCESYAGCSAVGPDDVEGSLTALGVDPTPTPRLGPDGEPLPDDYDPLGPGFASGRAKEVFFMGFQAIGSEGRAATGVAQILPAGSNRHRSRFLYDPSSASVRWAREAPSTATACDTDGNGLSEVAVFHSTSDGLTLRLIDQGTLDSNTVGGPFALATGTRGEPVAAAAGDLDGDGDTELVVLVTGDQGTATVFVIDREDDGFAVVATRQLPAVGNEFEPMGGQIDTGNVDGDPQDEILLVVNHRDRFQGGELRSGGHLGRVVLLDDLDRGLAQMRLWEFEAAFADTVGVAGAALGDIDGDGRDEVVAAWVAARYDGGIFGDFQVEEERFAFDDALRDYRSLGTSDGFADAQSEFCLQSLCDDDFSFYAPVHTLDMDGNGAHEVVVGGRVFRDWRGGSWRELDEIRTFGTQLEFNDRARSVFATGDVLGDGRDELLVFTDETGNAGAGEVKIYRLSGNILRQLLTDSFTTQVLGTGLPAIPPVVVTANLDGAVLEYTGESRQVWTQPLVNAVLAAPPCGRPGQVDDACRTYLDVADFWGGEREQTFTVSAGVHIGASFEAEIFGIEAVSTELKLSVTASATSISGSSYSLTKSVRYTTGANEDAVILTTIPYDQYDYRIAGHSNPERIGEILTLSLPREPVTVMVERGYYNERVAGPGDPRIGPEVLGHTIGDIESYPTRAQKNALLELYEGPDRWDGLESPLITISAGRGDVGTAVSFQNAESEGYALSIGASLEVSTTVAGVMRGFEVGVESESAMRYSKGQATEYRGTVGQIDPDVFEPGDGYSLGLFTYVYVDEATGQEFEVINFWVE